MDIILLQDIDKLGYKDDVVTVKDGYANNYLIPKGYAIMATPSNRKIIAENVRQRAFKEEKLRKDAQETADVLAKIGTVKIGAKVSGTGKIFGSITALQVADAIRDQYNQEVDRKKVILKGDTIREVGTYQATINVYKDIKAEISFEVVPE